MHELNNANVKLALYQIEGGVSVAVTVVQALENRACNVCDGRVTLRDDSLG